MIGTIAKRRVARFAMLRDGLRDLEDVELIGVEIGRYEGGGQRDRAGNMSEDRSAPSG